MNCARRSLSSRTTPVSIASSAERNVSILPRINEDVNEEWISDKTRHHVDALVRNRLDRPWIREKGKLRQASWQEALQIFGKRLKKAGSKVAAIAGDLLDAETMYAAKKLITIE